MIYIALMIFFAPVVVYFGAVFVIGVISILLYPFVKLADSTWEDWKGIIPLAVIWGVYFLTR